MSASLDYKTEYRPTTAPPKLSRSRRNKQKHRRKVRQFFLDFPNCYYCGIQLTRENRSLDHYIPRALGGTGVFENLVTACKVCNGRKGDSLPSEMETIPKIEWRPTVADWQLSNAVGI